MLWYYLPYPAKIAMHDIWMGLVTELFGRPEFISEKLILYRRHDKNLTQPHLKSKYSLGYKIKYRVVLLYYLLSRLFREIKPSFLQGRPISLP